MTYGKYLLLGSNLGDKQRHLDTAKTSINEFSPIILESSVYSTAAWGKTDQPSFLNQVIQIKTHLTPHELLNKILEVENTMGRVRKEKWGARIIDIDILYYDDLILDTPELKIPHPGIPQRKFTLKPLNEISPAFKNPLTKLTNHEMLTALNDDSIVNKH